MYRSPVATFTDLEKDLPWEFHDAYIEGVTIDWLAETLALVMRFPMTKNQEVERRARVTVTGLFFCSIEPLALGSDDYKHIASEGLWVGARAGAAKGAAGLPPLPDEVFLHHFYVASWNYRTIHVACRDARLDWLEDEMPRKGPGGARFPGEEIPNS